MKMNRAGASTKTWRFSTPARACTAAALAALFQAQCDVCLAQESARIPYNYNQYVNRGYGYSICYPDGIFVPQGEAVSGAGQAFRADDGAELRVHADYNISYKSIKDSFADAVADESRNASITFKLQEGNWYVISGTIGSRIFYRKTILDGEKFITFRALYPASLNSVYSGVVTILAGCLKTSMPD
jgi:hypothetical protein